MGKKIIIILHLSFCLSRHVLYKIHHTILLHVQLKHILFTVLCPWARHFMLVKHRKTENHTDMTEKLLRETFKTNEQNKVS